MALLLSSNVSGNLQVSSNVSANAYLFTAPINPVSAPGVPPANVGGLYVKNVANTILFYTTYAVANNTTYDTDVPLQSHMGFRDVFRVMPSSNNIANNVTCFFSDSMTMNVQANAVTFVYPSNASPIYKNSKTRVQLNTNSTLLGNANACVYANQNVVWTGNGAGTGNGGGFLYTTTFSVDALANANTGNTSTSLFVGLANLNAVIPFSVTQNTDPCVNTVFNMVGCGSNATTKNLQIIFGVAGATRNLVDCGANFTISTSDVYELTLWASPSAVAANSVIGVRVRNLTNGAEVSALTTSNTPKTNTFLSPITYVQGNTQGTGTALAVQNVQVSIIRSYLEMLY